MAIDVERYGLFEWRDMRWLVQAPVVCSHEEGRELLTMPQLGTCPHRIQPIPHIGYEVPKHPLVTELLPKKGPRFVYWEYPEFDAPGWISKFLTAYGVKPGEMSNHFVGGWALKAVPPESFYVTNLMPYFIFGLSANNVGRLKPYIEASYVCERPIIAIGSSDVVAPVPHLRIKSRLLPEHIRHLTQLVELKMWEYLYDASEAAPVGGLS